MIHILAAPDKFRGTVSAQEAAAAIASAGRKLGARCTVLPLADGGEGTLAVLGGGNRTSRVTGPLGAEVDAQWRLDGSTAVIEMAQASGLTLAGGHSGNDPLRATSRGTGELIDNALRAGASRVIVTVGGSACTDGGLGALEAIERWAPFGQTRAADIVVATDVRTVFRDAAEIFGPQKGADAAQVRQLAVRLRDLAELYAERYGVDITAMPGTGAAGGLAGAIVALGGRIVDGFRLVAESCGLAAALTRSTLVVTGEGHVDQSSLHGKVVGGVIKLAQEKGVPAAVVAGQIDSDVQLNAMTVSLSETFGAKRSWNDTMSCIEDAVLDLVQRSSAMA